MLLSQSGLSRGLAALIFAVVLCVIFFWPGSNSAKSASVSSQASRQHSSAADAYSPQSVPDPARHPVTGASDQKLVFGEKMAHVKATVVASMDGDDTSWLYDYFPDWYHNIYTVDDPSANLTVPINKGRESQVYLTYIIDNYHDLPEYLVFLHALRYQWHNEDPMYGVLAWSPSCRMRANHREREDGVFPLRNLQLPYVNKMGYANMRCTWMMGCPAELHPAKAVSDPEYRKWDRDKDRVATEKAYAEAHSIIFPESKTPPATVGVPCGAQFAVARWRVLERPRADYERIRDWLTRTHMPDAVSGRILEYTWHSES